MPTATRLSLWISAAGIAATILTWFIPSPLDVTGKIDPTRGVLILAAITLAYASFATAIYNLSELSERSDIFWRMPAQGVAVSLLVLWLLFLATFFVAVFLVIALRDETVSVGHLVFLLVGLSGTLLLVGIVVLSQQSKFEEAFAGESALWGPGCGTLLVILPTVSVVYLAVAVTVCYRLVAG